MDHLNFLSFLAYGLVVGVLARTLFPSPDRGGLLITSLLGILGSVIGGWIFNLFGWEYTKGVSLNGLLPALVGSILILSVYTVVIRLLKGKLSK